MRRSLAGLLFGLAAIVGSLAVSGFWMQYTAFSPDHTKSAAHAVLADNDIKAAVAKGIAEATTPLLNTDPAHPVTANEVQAIVIAGAGTAQGSNLLAQVVADAHARLIGASNKPVQITAAEMVPLVGNELAATVPTVTLDVPKVTALSVMRQVLKWLVPIAGGVAILLILLGFAAHPERAELLRSLGFLLLGMALLLAIIGYVVPALVLPLFSKNVWVGALPRLARDSLPLLAGLVFVLVGIGLGCLAAAGATRRRDRWSQPIRTRYNDQRSWS